MNRLACLLALLGLLAAPPAAAIAQSVAMVDGSAVALEPVVEGLDNPLFLTSPPGDDRLFIVEQAGTIRIVSGGALLPEPFLDVSGLISAGGERGLLGLAFHPGYASNRRFFIYQTAPDGDLEVVGYTASADPDIADPPSAVRLLSIPHPLSNHNGGWLDFGPDGYLYIATGDGGGAGDLRRNAQNRDSLLGKILRIDVSAWPYRIPPDNPYAASGGAPEIFLIGVRNPWRNAFDGTDLYIADVGQGAWEEISVVTTADAGANLGWNSMEGPDCFRPRTGCETDGQLLPIHAYSHDEGCSITGGYVYRGAALPALDGRYVFADYCAGELMSLRYANGQVEDLVNLGDQLGVLGRVTSFGRDGAGELYVVLASGLVAKLVPARP